LRFKPKGVEPSTWVKLLVELISLAYFGGEGSSHLIVKAIDSCYKEFGIYKGSKSYPSFIDVHNKIKLMKVKGRSAEWMQTVLKGFKGTPLMESFLRQVRELGIGCILIDQEPSSLSRTVIANTNTQFTFKLNEQRDVNTAGSYSLISDKAKAVFGLISIGMAVVRIHRHPSPFLVRVSKVLERKGMVSDEDVKKHMQKFKGTTKNYSQIDLKKSEPSLLILPTPKEVENKENDLLDDAHFLLTSILEHPLWLTSERYREMDVGAKKGTLLIRKLIDSRLIKAVSFRTSYAKIVLYDLTDKAKVLLMDKGKCVDKFPKSLLHEFGVNMIVQFYKKQRLTVHREVQCEGGYIDVVIYGEDKKLLIEFETGKSDILKNIRKCLSFDSESKVIVVGMNSAVKKKIEKIIQDKKLHSERLAVKLLGKLR